MQTLKVSKTFRVSPLIEATCNQVNQFGGYTGMTPKDFVSYIRGVAAENDFPFEDIILGGYHLGPNVWQNEPAESAMDRSKVLIRDYVQAGFVKIHIDCSMRLNDDPEGALDPQISAFRTAQLAKVAERFSKGKTVLPRYVVGTEVPIPGGAQEHETGVQITKVEDVSETLQMMHQSFVKEGLEAAWERDLAVVVQPGHAPGRGLACQDYTMAMGQMMTTNICATTALQFPAPNVDYKKFASFAGAGAAMANNPMFKGMGKMVDEMKKIEGLTIAETTAVKVMGRSTETSKEAVEIKKGAIAASAFDVAALTKRYKKIAHRVTKMAK